MTPAELRRASASRLRRAFRSGESSAVAAAEAVFAAIDAEDERLGAWLHLRRDRAHAEAASADARFAAARKAGAEIGRAHV